MAKAEKTTKLKHCPFCKSEYVHIAHTKDGWAFVICNNCDAQGPVCKAEEEAVKYWNVRFI